MLDDSVAARDCQQHVVSERELSRAFPHPRSIAICVHIERVATRAHVTDHYSLVEYFRDLQVDHENNVIWHITHYTVFNGSLPSIQ